MGILHSTVSKTLEFARHANPSSGKLTFKKSSSNKAKQLVGP